MATKDINVWKPISGNSSNTVGTKRPGTKPLLVSTKPVAKSTASKGSSYTQVKKPSTKRETMATNRVNRAAYESATKRERMAANRAVKAGTATAKQKQIAAHTQKLKINKSK